MNVEFLAYDLVWTTARFALWCTFIIVVGRFAPKNFRATLRWLLGGLALLYVMSLYHHGFFVERVIDAPHVTERATRSQQYGADLEIIAPAPRTEKLEQFRPLGD